MNPYAAGQQQPDPLQPHLQAEESPGGLGLDPFLLILQAGLQIPWPMVFSEAEQLALYTAHVPAHFQRDLCEKGLCDMNTQTFQQ